VVPPPTPIFFASNAGLSPVRAVTYYLQNWLLEPSLKVREVGSRIGAVCDTSLKLDETFKIQDDYLCLKQLTIGRLRVEHHHLF
jgi:hypothetical protein